jgi:hypothetical protein
MSSFTTIHTSYTIGYNINRGNGKMWITFLFIENNTFRFIIYGSKEYFVGNEANGELKSEGLLSRQFIFEQDEDVLTEIQDEACEIVYDSRLPNLTFPVKISPFTTDELIQRLPLEFQVQSPYYVQDDSHDHDVFASKMSFLIQQVTDRQSAQEDVGFGKFFKFQLGFVF